MATLNIKVITTYNNKLYKEYAHRFKETYNWPFELIVYNEDEKIQPDLKAFVERNKDRQPYSDYKVKGNYDFNVRTKIDNWYYLWNMIKKTKYYKKI